MVDSKNSVRKDWSVDIRSLVEIEFTELFELLLRLRLVVGAAGEMIFCLDVLIVGMQQYTLRAPFIIERYNQNYSKAKGEILC